MSEPAEQISALSQVELDDFTSKLVTALKTVYDPEIPVDIYELGLIYKVDVADNKDVTVDMTLTARIARWRARCPAWSRRRWTRWTAWGR